MIICPRCKYQAPDGTPYCPNCGLGKPIQSNSHPSVESLLPAASITNQTPRKKLNPWLIVCGGLVFCFILFLCIIFMMAISESSESPESLKPTLDLAILATNAQATINAQDAALLSVIPTLPAIQPSATPPTENNLPFLGAEYKKISNLTDFQKEAYLLDMIGKEYRVVGKIAEVRTNGIVQLDLLDSTFFAISLVDGYPYDRLMNLQKGDVIDFVGEVSKTDTFLYLTITTKFIRDSD